MNRNATELKIR